MTKMESISLKQVGTASPYTYQVVRLLNRLEPVVGTELTADQVLAYISGEDNVRIDIS